MDTTGEFPPGFEHLAGIAHDAQEQLRRLDELIENPPVDSGPRLGYSPPGSIGDLPPTTREQKIEKLKKQQELVRSSAFSKIENALTSVDVETAKVVREKSLEKIYPNQYKQMNAMEKKAHESERKDIFVSQDFVSGQIEEGKLKAARKNVSKDTEQEKIGPITKSVIESFSYNKSFKEADAEKLREKDNVIETKEPLGAMSSSFMQRFSYVEAQMDTYSEDYNSREKEKDSPEPEI